MTVTKTLLGVRNGWAIYGVLDTTRIDGKTVWWLFDYLSSERGTPAHRFDTHTEALKYAADRPLNDIRI